MNGKQYVDWPSAEKYMNFILKVNNKHIFRWFFHIFLIYCVEKFEEFLKRFFLLIKLRLLFNWSHSINWIIFLFSNWTFRFILLSFFSRLYFSFSLNKSNRFAFFFLHELRYNKVALRHYSRNFFFFPCVIFVRINFQYSRIFKRQQVKRARTKALWNKWIFLYELWPWKLNVKWNKRTEWKNNKLQRMCYAGEQSKMFCVKLCYL